MWTLFHSLLLQLPSGGGAGWVKLETPLGRASDENHLMAPQSGLRSGERPGSATTHKAIKPDVAASHRASAAEEE